MEIDLPREWSALCAMIFLLGAKHGLDADHLATIDGLTRFNAHSKPRLAAMCGMLFSIGHGAMVVSIALAVSLIADNWQAPDWLATTGVLVSVLFLTVLGIVNLRAVLVAKPHEVVRTVGLKRGMLGGLAETSHPVVILTIGALFALSFDTVSQAALFAMTAKHYGGSLQAMFLGLMFMLGMLATDCINGLWIARLIRRSDAMERIASRVMGVTIAVLSLGIATVGLTKWGLPAVDHWLEKHELWAGFMVVLTILLAFIVASTLGKRACRA